MRPIEYRTDWLVVCLIGGVFCSIVAVIADYALWFKQWGWIAMTPDRQQDANMVMALFGLGAVCWAILFVIAYAVQMIQDSR